MTVMRSILGCGLLITSLYSWADTANGRVKGVVDGRSLDVAVVCEREKIGNNHWLKVQSDPSMHGGVSDRNGDGVAVSVSSDSKRAVFEVLVGGQKYRFTGAKDVSFSDAGLAIDAVMKRYEGSPRKEVGQYEVRLEVLCPKG
ncbi:hypothetical protein [Quisquiliibacterium transsilvanicum]|uniref:Uncharacterized protein n=1 Tax=Quisquiliibacterium transsilvanicum TaxID=1549638 RepID=A0A7W8M9T1_9BURK|nr:hypothetical protein [Quisquiliibacterium transsilvanicum]MBB5273223.1 hypothetical protein [Quisquiliibacterium transsilvanicum]